MTLATLDRFIQHSASTRVAWTTPNGRKISIRLEELGLPHRVRPANLDRNEQFAPEFLNPSPNNKTPALAVT